MTQHSLETIAAIHSGRPWFDYDLQVWVRAGIVQSCGHPESMRCGCNARKYAGMTRAEALRDNGPVQS